MLDFYLKFTDKQDADAAIAVAYPPRNESIFDAGSRCHSVDVIGVITRPGATDEDEPITLEGYHVNIRCYALPSALAGYAIDAPANPARKWIA